MIAVSHIACVAKTFYCISSLRKAYIDFRILDRLPCPDYKSFHGRAKRTLYSLSMQLDINSSPSNL